MSNPITLVLFFKMRFTIKPPQKPQWSTMNSHCQVSSLAALQVDPDRDSWGWGSAFPEVCSTLSQQKYGRPTTLCTKKCRQDWETAKIQGNEDKTPPPICTNITGNTRKEPPSICCSSILHLDYLGSSESLVAITVMMNLLD